MKHTLSLSAILLTFWLVMSGHVSPLMISLGLLSVLLVMIIVHRMDIVDHETLPLHVILRLPRFLFWLAGDLLVSNIIVVKNIWRRQLAVSPILLVYKFRHSSDLAKMVYANTITVTPGTVTIDLQGETVTIHSLTSKACENILTGEKESKARQLVG